MRLQRWKTTFQCKYHERVNFVVTWLRRGSAIIAILHIVISVCLIACGPANAIDLAAKHDSLPNATHCPAHPDSNDSQDPQLPERAPSCGQTDISIIFDSLNTSVSRAQSAQLVVLHLTLVELDVSAFPHSFTLPIHVLHSSIPPAAGTLRL